MSLWMLFVLLALIKLPLIGLMLWMPFRNDEAAIVPNLARPMNGLVEAICSTWSWEGFDQDVRELTERSAELIADWKP